MSKATGDKKYKRILLKLSGEALTGSENFGIDPKILDLMALEIGQLVGIGVQVVSPSSSNCATIGAW